MEDQSYHIWSRLRPLHVHKTQTDAAPGAIQSTTQSVNSKTAQSTGTRKNVEVLSSRLPLRNRIPEAAQKVWARCLLAALSAAPTGASTLDLRRQNEQWLEGSRRLCGRILRSPTNANVTGTPPRQKPLTTLSTSRKEKRESHHHGEGGPAG